MLVGRIIGEMAAYNCGCPELVNHALKVFGFAKAIGEQEGLDNSVQQTLEIAAVLHDIGILESERKYHSYEGGYQQIEGPPIAREILMRCEVPSEVADRVCYLIAHHHEYDHIDGLDYQILVEADFLVNLFEQEQSREQAQQIRDSVFCTAAGKRLLEDIFFKTPPVPSSFAVSLP